MVEAVSCLGFLVTPVAWAVDYFIFRFVHTIPPR